MFVIELLCVVVIILTGSSSDAEDALLCNEVAAEDLDDLQYVKAGTFVRKNEMSFHFLPKISDTNNITEAFIGVDSSLVFRFEPQNSSEICVTLVGLNFERQQEKSTRNTLASREDNHKCFEFLKNFPELNIKASFSSEQISGVVDVDSTCWEEHTSANCIINLRVLKKLKQSLIKAKNPFSQDFWDSVTDTLVSDFTGKIDTFHVAFESGPENAIAGWLFSTLGGKSLDEVKDIVDILDFKMSSNNWGNLTSGYLPQMRHVISLNLAGNGITFIDPDIFTRATNMTSLVLGRNNLRNIPEPIFRSLTHLEFLDLSDNSLDDFSDLQNIENIQRLTELKYVNMSHTNIKDWAILKPLLQHSIIFYSLDFSNCSLGNLTGYSDVFSKQRKLNNLYLSGNNISNSPKFIFKTWEPLKILDLSYNNFTSPKDIVRSGDVEYLDLSVNNIANWFKPDDATSDSVFKNINHLNLSRNTIPVVTSQMGETMESLRSVDLGGNPINCDNCSIPEFKSWLKKNKTVKILAMNKTNPEFYCVEPTNKKYFTVENVFFDEELCLLTEENIVPFIAIPIAATLSLFLVSGVLAYVYRYEVTYLIHLVKIKRKTKSEGEFVKGNYKYDAFVCYSGPDRVWVLGELMPTLENSEEKYRLCLHERDFALGSFITQNIIEAMQNSRRTIVVLSQGFINSQWCKWELEMANHKLFEEKREFLILIELERLDRTLLPRHLKFLMDTRTYLEWPSSDDGHGHRINSSHVIWKRLKTAMGESLHQINLKRLRMPRPSTSAALQESRI